MSDSARKETRAERKRREVGEFVGHLLTAPTVAIAAQKMGISPRTATRWIRSEAFRDAFVESRRATFTNLQKLLQAGSVGSVEALCSVIADASSAPTARTAAARAVLDGLLRVTEVRDLEDRMARLEALVNTKESDSQ